MHLSHPSDFGCRPFLGDGSVVLLFLIHCLSLILLFVGYYNWSLICYALFRLVPFILLRKGELVETRHVISNNVAF